MGRLLVRSHSSVEWRLRYNNRADPVEDTVARTVTGKAEGWFRVLEEPEQREPGTAGTVLEIACLN